MLITAKGKRVGVGLTVVMSGLILAAAWAVLGKPEDALPKKPAKPPGGGNTSTRLARIVFTDSPQIQWDGRATCDGWDYWDERDVALGCIEAMGCRADVSGGGRLKFLTIWQGDDNAGSPRWLVLNFNDGGDSNQDPDIDRLIYKAGYHNNPPVNGLPGYDNVKTLISLDRMFKKGATRQPLTISICINPDGSAWRPAAYSLRWRADLHIVETTDPDVRILKTGPALDEEMADLLYEDVVVGAYRMPLDWGVRLVR